VDCLTSVADQFWEQTRNGLTIGAIYAMIALGYTMVYGVLQLINFAHSEVFMVGVVVSWHAVTRLFGVEEPLAGMALALVMTGVILLAMTGSAVTAVAIERFAYRPLRRRGAPRLSFLISAIGASLFLQYLFALSDGRHYLLFVRLPDIQGPGPRAFPIVMESSTVFEVFGVPITNRQLLVIVVAIVMMVLLDRFVRRTRLGRGMRAVAQDPETASLMGVSIDRVVVTTFALGGLMAGAAGFLYVTLIGAPSHWAIGFLPGLKAFAAAVLGGIGNIRGAMLGGLLIGLVEAHATACVGSQWQTAISFLVLVGVLMLRPSGILGTAR
jgi:branched-chain amino acid transport system permease protein